MFYIMFSCIDYCTTTPIAACCCWVFSFIVQGFIFTEAGIKMKEVYCFDPRHQFHLRVLLSFFLIPSTIISCCKFRHIPYVYWWQHWSTIAALEPSETIPQSAKTTSTVFTAQLLLRIYIFPTNENQQQSAACETR